MPEAGGGAGVVGVAGVSEPVEYRRSQYGGGAEGGAGVWGDGGALRDQDGPSPRGLGAGGWRSGVIEDEFE